MKKHNCFRNAVLKSNSDRPVLDILSDSLTDGYTLNKNCSDFYINDVSRVVIETPSGDKIVLTTTENERELSKLEGKKILKTSNIIKQDSRDVQPDLANDELTKLKQAMISIKEIEIDIVPSNKDLS